MLTVAPVLPVDGRAAPCLTHLNNRRRTSRVAIALRRVKLFARSSAVHASSQSTFFNRWGVVGAARAQCSKNSPYIAFKVNVALYKELFLELASGHVTIVTRVRRSTCFG